MIGYDFAAGPLTPPAQDAAVMFHEQMLVRGIDGEGFCEGRVQPVIDAVSVPQILQLTVSGGFAERAEVVSLREEQIKDQFPRHYNLRRFCLDHHPFGDWKRACRD
jgi:hypothetical protein